MFYVQMLVELVYCTKLVWHAAIHTISVCYILVQWLSHQNRCYRCHHPKIQHNMCCVWCNRHQNKSVYDPITPKPQYKTKIIIIIIIISMVSHTIIILIPYNTTTTTYYFKPSNNKKRNTHTFHQTLFAWQLYLAQLFILSPVHT